MQKIIFLCLFLILSNFLCAQTIGEIFDKDFADSEFGEVLSSVEIANDELRGLLLNAGEYILLNIDTGKIRAVDKDRNSILGNANSADEVFYKMSTSKVNLLIEKGKQPVTKVEMRPETLTLTNGSFTLEMVVPCPPNCD
jgi:hypothetical protein